MAYLPQDDEKNAQQSGDLNQGGELNQQVPQQEDQQSLSNADTLSSYGGVNPAQQRDTTGKGSAAGARFRNLKSYMDKSKSNIAGQIGQTLTKQKDIVANQQDQTALALKQQREAEQERLTTGEKQFGTLDQAQQTIQTQAQQLAGGQGLDQFRQYQAGQAADFNDVAQRQAEEQKRIQDLQAKQQQAATEQGRFGLLKDVMGAGRQYGGGAQRLDQLLLQTQKPQLQQLQDIRKNLTTDVAKTQQDIASDREQAVADISGRANTLKENIGLGLTQAQTSQQSDLQNRLNALKESEEYKEIMGEDELTNAEINELLKYQTSGLREVKDSMDSSLYGLDAGMQDNLAANLYGLDRTAISNVLNNYRTNLLDTNVSDIATEQDLAQAKALSLLGNQEQSFLNEDRVGKFDLNKIRSDVMSDIQKQIDPRKQEAETYLRQMYENADAERKAIEFQRELGAQGLRLDPNNKFSGVDKVSFADNRAVNPRSTEFKDTDVNILNPLLEKYGLGRYGNVGQAFIKGIYSSTTPTGYKSVTQTQNEASKERQKMLDLLKLYGYK